MPCRAASPGIMISRGPDVDTHVVQHKHTPDEKKIDEDVFSWPGKRPSNVGQDWKTAGEVGQRKRGEGPTESDARPGKKVKRKRKVRERDRR